MKLIPLYFSHSRLLIGLQEDYIKEPVQDGLVIEIDLDTGRFAEIAWSGQKILKSGYFDSIAENEREEFISRIKRVFSAREIEELENTLLNPPKESVESLIWLPERLRKGKEEETNEQNSEL